MRTPARRNRGIGRNWQGRLYADLPEGEPTKPSKPGFVGFVGAIFGNYLKIEAALGLDDRLGGTPVCSLAIFASFPFFAMGSRVANTNSRTTGNLGIVGVRGKARW
jgi:hypothetical protein